MPIETKRDEIDEGGRIYQALTEDLIRRMRNWVRGKDGTPIASSFATNIVDTSGYREATMPILFGEAADTELAVRTLPGRYQDAVRQFWNFEGRSLRWHARRRRIENENTVDSCPNLKYDTFERWVICGHELLKTELARRSERYHKRVAENRHAVASAN